MDRGEHRWCLFTSTGPAREVSPEGLRRRPGESALLRRRAVTRRRPLTVLAAAVITASLPISTARAEPFAGQIDRASIQTSVIGADGREWLIRIQIEEVIPAAGATSLMARVAIDTCSGNRCTGKAFAQSLDPSEFTLGSDMTMAELSTRITGRPLEIRWECGESCGSFGSTVINVGGSVRDTSYQDMVFEGKLFGIECSGAGAAEKETGIDPAGGPHTVPGRPPKSLPQGFLDGPRKARC